MVAQFLRAARMQGEPHPARSAAVGPRGVGARRWRVWLYCTPGPG